MSEKKQGKTIQAVRGMRDILPDEVALVQMVEAAIKALMASYGYQEIRFPILESTALFKRSIGEETDIVGKEMYTFEDRNGDSLSMRPEGTVGCIRAGIEKGLFYNQIQRLWYMGPMFRHERPQKGRYRQFNQWGVEVVGVAGYSIEAELIQMCRRLWEQLEIDHKMVLQVNTLGSPEERKKYREALVTYFEQHDDRLTEDEQHRLANNPLRLLDSKNPKLANLIQNAPKLLDHLGDDSRRHFDGLLSMLDALGIVYEHNHHLVRGLDYYHHSVFEWVTPELGAQNTVCAGGRYDGLISQLGGHAAPAVGFALGVERLCELLADSFVALPTADVMVVFAGEGLLDVAVPVVEAIRERVSPFCRIVLDHAGGSLKAQMKRAHRYGVRYVMVMGDDEREQGSFTIKSMGDDEGQEMVAWSEVPEWLMGRLD